MSKRMAKDMSERMSERMPDRMSKRMFKDVSSHMVVFKCHGGDPLSNFFSISGCGSAQRTLLSLCRSKCV